jgi:hypothetical protein
LIFKQNTYRSIALAFIVLFLSFIFAPTVLVTAVDDDLDVTMAFNLVEEETKETKEKATSMMDDFFHAGYFFPLSSLEESKGAQNFFNSILAHLYCPGEVAPPPEFS